MPRKDFRADLAAAVEQNTFLNISNVAPGEDDGEITFYYKFQPSEEIVQISALISDVSDYSKSHTFHLFTTDHAPPQVASALQDAPKFSGQTVQLFLPRLSNWLDTSTAHIGQGAPCVDVDGDSELPLNDELDDDHSDTYVDEDWSEDDDILGIRSTTGHNSSLSARAESGSTPRADLRAAKAAGFKIGAIGVPSPNHSCYISVACRMSRLGISDEALDAWNLNLNDYLILLIYYPFGYFSIKDGSSLNNIASRAGFQTRVGVSHTYKPMSVTEAQKAFKDYANEALKTQEYRGSKSKDSNGQKAGADGLDSHLDASSTRGFKEMFISRPLNSLLNDRFLSILKLRFSNELSWSGAERLFEKLQRDSNKLARSDEENEENEQAPYALPDLVTADELRKQENREFFSLPLVAMQFTLRHFVRSTEFCLICHSKLPPEIEAIKPYVCESPLCLFQYMNLGFGPSLEHEILTQPYVVDILISFCYVAAASNQLKSHPEGLGWNVLNPPVADYPFSPQNGLSPTIQQPIQRGSHLTGKFQPQASSCLYAHLNTTLKEILFDLNVFQRTPVRVGTWLMIRLDTYFTWHARVSDTSSFPTIRLDHPILRERSSTKSGKPGVPSFTSESIEVKISIYDCNFDKLEKHQMNQSIQALLDILPSVEVMHNYLSNGYGRRLDQWTSRINPASLGLLRWILASNRSCIMQVDQPKFMDQGCLKKRVEGRVNGMAGWLQFRFAMGAPDKEQRFINAISKYGGPTFKTLFAWHGSSLENWHSIIREGLRFDRVLNGRAHGDGCYFAKDFGTSSSYSHRSSHRRYSDQNADLASEWSESILKISSAIALSEIVNAPTKYISQNPYYVVNQLDWIQTRYLFVQPQAEDLPDRGDQRLTWSLKQDPERVPRGPNHHPIILPLTAIPKSRRSQNTIGPSAAGDGNFSSSVATTLGSGPNQPILIDVEEDDDESASVVTHPEDREILAEPEEDITLLPVQKSRTSDPILNFDIRPIDNLPSMPLPTDAAPAASQRLQRDLRKLLDSQASHIKAGTLADIGWYMDPEHIVRTGNLFQWVVELHSFPLTLPLANDLKNADMQSVILEIRFPATYPFSPPFVRIVRPRFLMFSQGGGGHVTSGGSICMDLLTASGWTAANDIESVLLQIRVALMSTTPYPARLEKASQKKLGRNNDYDILEAIEAFKRVAQTHGWKVPDGMGRMALEWREGATGSSKITSNSTG